MEMQTEIGLTCTVVLSGLALKDIVRGNHPVAVTLGSIPGHLICVEREVA